MIITFVVDDMRRQYLIAVIILLNLAAVAQVIVSPEFQYSDIIAQEKFPLELNNINDSVNDAKQGTASPIVVDYVSESVLSTGSWVKMGILNTGVHKLTFDDIENMGFNPLQLDVNKIGVFGNYSGLLPEANNISRPDDLQENSIFISGADDGSFDVDDYILFYGHAATTWSYYPFVGRFTHETNIFSDTTYYFFTPDKGTAKPVEELDGTGYEPTQTTTSFIDYSVHERDFENMLSSGKEWYGERFTGDTLEREFTFLFPNHVINESVYFDMKFIARSFTDSYYDIFINDEIVSDSTKIRFLTPGLPDFAREANTRLTTFVDNDVIKVKVVYYSDDANAIGWLDYIALNAERDLIFNGEQMNFCDPSTAALGNITRFNIENAGNNEVVWDITDIHNPKKVLYSIVDEMIYFSLPTDTLKTFVVFNNSDYYSPISYKEVQNQDLHGISDVNFVIIRPDMFGYEAELLANIHREHDNLTTISVSPEQIYNEFSSGSQDITAIRDFMRMLDKEDAFGGERAYLLLFGDASFDYKHRIHNNTNIVPTYESAESLNANSSFATDDYFGLLDDDEGRDVSGNLDIGIGRFPISTNDEAVSTINKIEKYLTRNDTVMSDWRTNICFAADDGNNNLHLIQAEGLISIADTLNKGLGINKIFMDAYNKVSVPGGFRYPDVNTVINKQVLEGALIINYTGHGGLIGWSDELVLDVPMINAFDNIDKLPLIITATCEFSRFDDPEFTSAGEYFFLNKKGGAIALLTTTRLAYAHANYIVNRRIYTNLMACEDGSKPRLGDLVRLSKIPSNVNYLNFALLGDPALTLAYPEYTVATTESNIGPINVLDTIHALSVVNVSGNIQDYNGDLVTDFNGFVYPKVVDKATLYTTLGNDGDSYPQDFYLFDKLLFDGRVEVKNGEFEFEFMVPKDISYNYGYGKIRYYALDTVNYIDAWGGFDQLYIGGIDEDADIDDIGPDIELYLNSTTFNSGDIVTGDPVMLTYISDDHGINSTGNGLGRDIVMTIDDDYSNSIILNEDFIMDINSYKAGKIVYPLNGFTKGKHTLSIKAWDLLNNSSEKTIEFFVDDEGEIHLTQVFNYPNPFYDYTIFEFVHNKSEFVMEVIIRIYDINGNFIVELSNYNAEGTSLPKSITWDGRNKGGDVVSAGIFVYTVEVRDNYGNVTVQQQKLFKINK